MKNEDSAVRIKRFLFSLQMAIVVTICHLHQPVHGQVNYGVKAGMNITNAKFENFESNVALRYHIGFLSSFKLSNQLALQTELLYSQKGWNVPDDFYNYNKDVSITLHYISLPVLLHYTWNERFALGAGTEVSYNLRTQRKPSIEGWVDLYEPWDIGLLASMSYRLRPSLAAELRYVYGLSALFELELRDPNNVPLGSFKEGKNRTLQVSLIYYLN